jgi:hypothetical protein
MNFVVFLLAVRRPSGARMSLAWSVSFEIALNSVYWNVNSTGLVLYRLLLRRLKWSSRRRETEMFRMDAAPLFTFPARQLFIKLRFLCTAERWVALLSYPPVSSHGCQTGIVEERRTVGLLWHGVHTDSVSVILMSAFEWAEGRGRGLHSRRSCSVSPPKIWVLYSILWLSIMCGRPLILITRCEFESFPG